MKNTWMKHLTVTIALLGIILSGWSQDAMAAPVSGSLLMPVLAAPGGGDTDTCTEDFPEDDDDDKEGLLTQVVDYIKEVIDDATRELYTGIIKNSSFLAAVNAAMVLFVTIFGVMFMFGIVPLTLGQALVRLFKMAIIWALITGGFNFFNNYAIKFFNDGTDELIDAVIGIAIGDLTGPSISLGGSPQPFRKMEEVVMNVFSPQMMVAAVSSFTTGPVGPAMGGMLGLGIMAFLQMIVKALRIYCMALIVKALLFGMAPIFISFMLFERTKHIFTGWINQLVNFSLQPLLMFTFLSFFVVLLQSSVDNILGVNICWTEFQHMSGTPNSMANWRFVDDDGNVSTSEQSWEGLVSCLQSGTGDCPDFPISIIDILTFFIIAHLAYRFSDVVLMIATEISSSTLFLDRLRGGLDNYFTRATGRTRAGAS